MQDYPKIVNHSTQSISSFHLYTVYRVELLHTRHLFLVCVYLKCYLIFVCLCHACKIFCFMIIFQKNHSGFWEFRFINILIFVFLKCLTKKYDWICFLYNRMCLEQGLLKEQLPDYVEKLMQTTEIPDKFKLTEKQLVQIAMGENMSIAQGICLC